MDAPASLTSTAIRAAWINRNAQSSAGQNGWPASGERAMSDWRADLRDRRVAASISGGKDSAAMGLWLMEQGIDYDRVFADTGWEHPKTYEYLRGPLTA